MSNTKRVSLTMPTSLVDDLDYDSRTLQITRSGLASELLTAAASQIRGIVELSIAATSNDANDDNAVTLARDPEKIRSYLSSISQAIEDSKGQFDREAESLITTMDGLKNEH